MMEKIVKLLKNNCCVFVGAGVPSNLGFPSWDKFAKDFIEFVWSKRNSFNKRDFRISMKQELESRVAKGEILIVITYCRDLLRDNDFEKDYRDKIISWLYDENKYSLAKNDTVYKLLKNIVKGLLVLQTNLDRSIEKFCGLSSYVNTNLPTQISAPALIYLHGVVTEPDSWILTTEAYNKFYQQTPSFSNFIQNIFKEYDILFLGYSLSDKEILDHIAKVKGSGRKYVLVLEEIERNKYANEVFESNLKHYDITVVRYNVEQEGFDAFVDFLKKVDLLLNPQIARLAKDDQDRSRLDEPGLLR